MRLYSGISSKFVEDTVRNQIAEKLKASFFNYYRYNPSFGEMNSWRNSLRAMSLVIQHSGLLDSGVILEYQLPLTSKRLDCIVLGKNDEKQDNAVIVELKQWDRCEPCESDNEVITWVGGSHREVLHPSAQVGQYKLYLEDTHTAFHDGCDPVVLSACSYLHNYKYVPDDPILALKFNALSEIYPLFSGDDFDSLSGFLNTRLKGGHGSDVLSRVEGGRYRPSKKLMHHVAKVIKGKPEYILLDEQLVVYDRVFTSARRGFHDSNKTVIIIKGGPGTGKSVIAINLMADLLQQGYNAHYVTGSRAFTETLRTIIGTRGAVQFKYFNSYGDAETDAVDVLICDEAHRIRKTSASRFTPREKRTGNPQISELIKACRVSVFLLDDDQVVRPEEIGSVEYIRQFAIESNCSVFEYELENQFRCSGSDAFVNWISNTLGIRKTANVIWTREEEFDFRIFGGPEELEEAIKVRVEQGHTARMAAGFCWKWSNPLNDGTLEKDVVIRDYRRPWNAKPNARGLAHGIPPATLWAHDKNGINQVGCIYTAQGFEFDYIGVIFGNDLTYNLDQQVWEGHIDYSADQVVKRAGDQFISMVQNTYRVLLTRGLRGCYVYFMDKDTERFFKSRIDY